MLVHYNNYVLRSWLVVIVTLAAVAEIVPDIIIIMLNSDKPIISLISVCVCYVFKDFCWPVGLVINDPDCYTGGRGFNSHPGQMFV
ncbi:unnamed protein product [Chrysodeixis includens]|uniref:Uncharacterized protein n=1 Tax=Chrysodeixis includens TaxID=689277 RepID=A0A9N8KP65_CHRIL|nr:unnamed protein product [Chrysodeixis includens]